MSVATVLSKTQRALLRIMVFREEPETRRACWLAPHPQRGRELALVVPTMMDTYEVLQHNRARTWQELAHAGLVTLGAVQELMPEQRHLAALGYSTAQSVTLTDLGRRAAA